MLKTFIVRQASLSMTEVQDINSIIYDMYKLIAYDDIYRYIILDTNVKDDTRRRRTAITIHNITIHSINYDDYVMSDHSFHRTCMSCNTRGLQSESMLRSGVSYRNSFLNMFSDETEYCKYDDVITRVCTSCMMMYYRTYDQKIYDLCSSVFSDKHID
jgi:hypothetical protein